jgi:GTP diphosphokinase / guanosine-3',5'-bis(diphosphate) 3'-diphosphatase
VAVLEVMAFDRSRLLLDVSKVVAEYHLNIISSSTRPSGSRIVRMVFDVELADPTHLSSLLAALKQRRRGLRRLPTAARDRTSP